MYLDFQHVYIKVPGGIRTESFIEALRRQINLRTICMDFLLRYDTSTFGKIHQTIRHSRILDVRFLGEFLTILTLILKVTAVCQRARYLCKL